jgi:hypothetical protein
MHLGNLTLSGSTQQGLRGFNVGGGLFKTALDYGQMCQF